MNKQKRWSFYLIGILSIFLSSCLSSRVIIGATPIITNNTSSANNKKQTATTTKLSNPTALKETLSPTIKATTSTPTEISTLTVIPFSTPVPTLSPEAAQISLADLIQKNGGCQLPCFLGIIPGVSTANDLEAILAPYSAILSILEDEDGKGFDFELGQEIKSSFYIDYRLMQKQHVLERIYLSTRAYSRIDYPYPDEYGDTYELKWEYGANTYHQLTNNDSLPKILTEYGVPEKILVYAEQYLYDGRLPSSNQQFGILRLRLFYPQSGIVFEYEMPLTKVGNFGQGCPTQAFVSFWLTPPDTNGEYAQEISKGLGQGNSFILEKPLNEATNMGAEKFYESFRVAGEKCLQTPLSLWPR